MKQQEFRRRLTSATPEMTDHFSNHVDHVLEELVGQEKSNMKKTSVKRIWSTGRISSRAIALSVVLVIVMAATAFAATQWHIFDSLSFFFGKNQPQNANAVMQGNLYHSTVNNVEITISEAGYDGRTLFVQYSYRILDVDYPFGNENGYITDSEMELISQHGLGWWVDEIWVNGKPLENVPDNSGELMMGSNNPGEIIVTDYWRLDHQDVCLNGPCQISLPIGEYQGMEYRASLYDREDDTYRLPDKGIVTFTYDAKDILSKVTVTQPNVEAKLSSATAKISEVIFSPLMTYITADIQVDSAAKEAFLKESGEGFQDENGNLVLPYSDMDVFKNELEELELVDEKGTQLFPERQGINGIDDRCAEWVYPCMTDIPDQLWLAPIRDGVGDLSQAIRVK